MFWNGICQRKHFVALMIDDRFTYENFWGSVHYVRLGAKMHPPEHLLYIFRHVSRLWMEFQPYLDGDLAVA